MSEEKIVMLFVDKEDCPYNDGKPYGIEYYDEVNDSTVECEWFETEQLRNEKALSDEERYGYELN